MSDLDIMARTLYGEARGEGRLGIEAVACVIMNRFKANKWFTGYIFHNGEKIPNISQTCLKKSQFSCWNKNDANLPIIKKVTAKDKVFQECLLIADNALTGGLQDFTNGALYYHTINIRPYWAKNRTPCFALKNHLFYNDI